MRIISIFVFIQCVVLSQNLYAQNDIPVGEWRTHLSYHHVIDIALAQEQVYAATSNAVFVYDKADKSIQTITKLDGLSGGEISAIAYADSHQTLVIGYDDGNIDLITDNIISTISIIKSDNFATDKRINSIYPVEDQAYLAADFGVSIIDLNTSSITETIINLGPNKVSEVIIYNDSIFAATSIGIMAASLDPSINILDFNNWTTYDTPSSEVISITVSNNQLYGVEKQGSLYQYEQGSWVEQVPLQGESFKKISPSSTGILVISESGISNIEEGGITAIDIDIVSTPNEISQDSEGAFWVADQTNGLIRQVVASTSESIIPSGPFSDRAFRTAFIQSEIFVLSGGISDNNLPLGREEGYYKFDNGRWDNYNQTQSGITIPQIRDLNDITYNPVTKQFVLASFQDGILLVDEDNTSSIVDSSTLGSSLTSSTISGITYANNGLWILNYGQDQSVHHWSDDGTWQAFSLNNTATKYPLDIMVAQNNDKWLRLSSSAGGGIFIFNEETGKQRLLNNLSNNGDLPSSEVHAITEDLDGLVWIGTSRGVAYFNSSSSVEDNNAVNAITPRVDFVPLLRDEKILAIAVDPGDRKWIGTENGVWLFDENGEDEIVHFNINNSPLPSNRVGSIGVNPTTGEVFFATDQGVVSYRGTATEATLVHQSVKIFPNPITSDFNGLVAISGLANNAIVKITDVSGKLVREMQASGGTATWNVRDYRGNRASTGVYLVFSSTDDGEDTFVGKMAVVN